MVTFSASRARAVVQPESLRAGGRPPADEDDEIIRRIASADPAALGKLYDRWSPRLYAVTLRMVGSEVDAEEVLERTFWYVWQHSASFDRSRGTMEAWLLRIARSRALECLRARKRSKEDPWSTVPTATEFASDTLDPYAACEATERAEIVRRAIDQLPEEQREVVLLAYFSGFSQSEIARCTGHPLGTIKTRARLALRKLRDHLFCLRGGVGAVPAGDA